MRLCCWRSAQPENSVRPHTVHTPSTLAQVTNQKTVNKILSNQNICTNICSFLYYVLLFFYIMCCFICTGFCLFFLTNQNWCRQIFYFLKKAINQSNCVIVQYTRGVSWVSLWGKGWSLVKCFSDRVRWWPGFFLLLLCISVRDVRHAYEKRLHCSVVVWSIPLRNRFCFWCEIDV